MRRHTVIAHGRHAMRERRLVAARKRQHGLHILTLEQLAARLAGGFTCSVDDETLRQVVQATLPALALGELDSLIALPGMVAAAVDTLSKLWHADIDLQARAASHRRLVSIATRETAVLNALPPTMMRPAELVAAALVRLEHAPTLIRTRRGRRPHRTCALLPHRSVPVVMLRRPGVYWRTLPRSLRNATQNRQDATAQLIMER